MSDWYARVFKDEYNQNIIQVTHKGKVVAQLTEYEFDYVVDKAKERLLKLEMVLRK